MPVDPHDNARYHVGMAENETTITVRRSKLYPQPGRVSKYQWVWYYECEGPDGRQFNNRDVSTLRSVLKQRYGRAVRIIEPWKTRTAA
jgi:hypothetical protein